MARVLFSGRISARREVFPADQELTLLCPKNVQKSVFFACFFALFFRHVGGGGAAAPRGTNFAPSPPPDLGKTQRTTEKRQKTACKLRDFRAFCNRFLHPKTYVCEVNCRCRSFRPSRSQIYQRAHLPASLHYYCGQLPSAHALRRRRSHRRCTCSGRGRAPELPSGRVAGE